jgi:hypothetical protein
MSIATLAPTDSESTSRNGFGASLIIAVVVMLVLMAGLVSIGMSVSNADRADKRAAFEHVLNMSSTDLEGKSLPELNGYRQDIVNASNYSVVAGNISGYDSSVVERELSQVNALILQKTDH